MAGLICKTIKGNQYWYIVESKRVNGKVKQEIIEYIGNHKKLADRVLKNNKTHALPDHIVLKSYKHGDSYALLKIAEHPGIRKIPDRTLGTQSRDKVERSLSLLLAAIHRVAEPGSKNGFKHWFEDTTLPNLLGLSPKIMTSQHFWEQMDGITEEELQIAEDEITKEILSRYPVSLDKPALDYTNYFTYISTSNDRNQIAKRGRNKQKRHDLRQCSLAVVTSKELGIPMFSHVYEGNRNDRTEFNEYLKLFKKRLPQSNPEEMTIVFDGGSVTKKNLEQLAMHYICSFSLSYCRELYDIPIADYEGFSVSEGKSRKAYRVTKEIWGKDRECLLLLSESLFAGQVREPEETIRKALLEFEKLKDKIANPRSRIDKTKEGLQKRADKILKKKYLSEIISVKTDDGVLSYELCKEKKAEIVEKYFGKKLLITDRKDWKTAEIIRSYQDQDDIEKVFRDTKNTDHFSIRPLYHWTDQKIRVHIFICLLGLTLANILYKEVSADGIKISKLKMLDELAGVREIWLKEATEGKSNPKLQKILEEMNSTQKKIRNTIINL